MSKNGAIMTTLARGLVDPRPHVVILGAGFGGLYAAKRLGRAPVRLTVVDRRNHHLFQPMLYQVATAALNPSDIANPIRSVLRRQRNTDVILGDAVSVDAAAREVLLADGVSLAYDYLIVATGAHHSYFGHAEWEPLAPGLKSIEDALEIRKRVLMAFELAEREADPALRQAYLTFVVVGGGPTGVEVAGALAEVRNFALCRDFRQINPRSAQIVLVEAGPRLLASYPEKLSLRAASELHRLGVEVRTNTAVKDVGPWSVTAGNDVIPARTVVWAAGNTASPLLATLRAPLDRQGRAVVESDCTIPGHPEVFVIGDAAHFEHGTKGPLPGISPVAIQMGEYAARVIRDEVEAGMRAGASAGDGSARSPHPRRPFSYWDKGQLAVIGRGHAVADIGRLHFGGFLAWLTWIFVHIFFLIGFRNRLLVMIQWAYSYFTFRRGARLITGEVGPATKTEPLAQLPTTPPGRRVPPPPAARPPTPQPEPAARRSP
ncbi:MAG TPA: NAD(P)/FAD-dependent oxidoreductase [Gemmatimonadales bacterium]|nr:NAD(P)/FAD-dependent oxidoreductase [Gemmatimonadales bacterium]